MNYTNSHVVSYYPMLPGLFRFEYRLANDVMIIVRVHSWDANIRKHLVDETQQWCAGASLCTDRSTKSTGNQSNNVGSVHKLKR